MTPESQQLILHALRVYKRENLAKAMTIAEGGLVAQNKQAQDIFAAYMAVDDQIELAIHEMYQAHS